MLEAMISRALIFLIACTSFCGADDADHFNYLLGTQAIGGRYQFTNDTKLLESAKLIRSLGSNVMKLTFSNEGSFGREKGNVPERPADVKTLVDLATKEPSHRAVLEMPFKFYLLWTYPLTCGTQAAAFKPEDQQRQYEEMREFAAHLLRTFSGTGKQFYLGHWEGDWHLRSHFDPRLPFPDGAQGRFTDWLKTRQRAIDDAKRETPHRDVDVWHYTEVNLVEPYLKNGGQCLTNSILPDVDVDFVSYSCYDAIQENIRDGLFEALDHIESKLRPKPGITGKRVFIGEYGFPSRRYPPAVQNRKTLEAMIAGIEWGCPFTLYWELYCNEFREGRHAGFWLIDNQNVKQPVWFTHENYFRWAAGHVREVTARTGRAPSDVEFRAAASHYLHEEIAKTSVPATPGIPPVAGQATGAMGKPPQ